MKKHILIVEDSMPAMLVEKMLMSHLGCEVDAATTGKQAILLVEQHAKPYDLILMDIGLPDMDGMAVSQLIRQHECNEGSVPVPIVAITGNADPTQHRLCLESGINEVYVKPLTKETAQTLLFKYASS